MPSMHCFLEAFFLSICSSPVHAARTAHRGRHLAPHEAPIGQPFSSSYSGVQPPAANSPVSLVEVSQQAMPTHFTSTANVPSVATPFRVSVHTVAPSYDGSPGLQMPANLAQSFAGQSRQNSTQGSPSSFDMLTRSVEQTLRDSNAAVHGATMIHAGSRNVTTHASNTQVLASHVYNASMRLVAEVARRDALLQAVSAAVRQASDHGDAWAGERTTFLKYEHMRRHREGTYDTVMQNGKNSVALASFIADDVAKAGRLAAERFKESHSRAMALHDRLLAAQKEVTKALWHLQECNKRYKEHSNDAHMKLQIQNIAGIIKTVSVPSAEAGNAGIQSLASLVGPINMSAVAGRNMSFSSAYGSVSSGARQGSLTVTNYMNGPIKTWLDGTPGAMQVMIDNSTR